MLSKIRGIIMMIWYKIHYGSAISFYGIPRFECRSRINLKCGTLKIGEGFSMKPNSYLAIVEGGKLEIGNGVSVARNAIVVCHESITIGDGCLIAPNVAIYDHDHKFAREGIKPGYKTAPVIIEKNCWLGAGVIILRGSHIGEGSVIGAGCIVKGDIPSRSLVTSDRKLNVESIHNRS